MNSQTRMSSCGAIAGIVSAAIGAGSALYLRPSLGWPGGLVGGAAVGGLAIYLASNRLLRDATACVAALGDEEVSHNQGRRRTDAYEPLAVLGSVAFDSRVARLYDHLARLRRMQVEYASALGLVRTLGESTNATSGSKPDSARPEHSSDRWGQPLLHFLDQIRQTAAHMNGELSSLEEANERVASGANDQSEAVARTATSVEALSERIDRISRNAGEAADACERARQEAQQGLEQVHTVIEGMDRLLTRIEANGRKVRSLEDRSTEIGVIVELIRGISSRTDMLALNATIESIRAGEHGRGFAIVAEEIRKAAERAAAATREIGTLVEAIQAETQESIRALNEQQAETQRESERIRETGSSLARISQVVEKSARLVEGISHSTNDQVLTTQDLVRAMQRIAEVAHQTQERTTKARAFIGVLSQSFKPWQRLAAVDTGASATSGSPNSGRQSPAAAPPPGSAIVTQPSVGSSRAVTGLPVSPLRGPSRVPHQPEREGVTSELCP
jgi:ABC-type transporter Mla subunit MlaD